MQKEAGSKWMSDAAHRKTRSAGGLQSLDVALPVLFALAEGKGPISLSDLAKRTRRPASKLHRYMSSFVHSGLVEQRPGSRLYDLGPMAMRLGIAALGRNDFTERTIERLADLTESLGLAAHVSVWGSYGPVVIRWQRDPAFPTAHLGLGATLPLLDSSAGRIYLANLPEPVTREALADSIKTSVTASEARRKGEDLTALIADLVTQTRGSGVATVDWPYAPSFCSVAAPVRNWQGEVEAVVTLVGLENDRHILEPGSEARAALLAYIEDISICLKQRAV